MRRWLALVGLVGCASSADAPPPSADAGAEVAAPSDGSIFCDANCDDGDPCTGDTCYQKIGCTHVPHAGGCDDGNPCTSGDNCATGSCIGKPLDCDDGKPCTDDACVLPGGCTHTSHC